MIIRELTVAETGLLEQAVALEQAAFGIGGMNAWFLVPFIRHGRVFVSLCGDEVVGVCEYMRDFWRTDHAYLFGLCVKEAWRRKGVGQRLLRESCLVLKAEGIESVSLTVHPGNVSAVRLYERMGFRRTAFREDEYGPGEHRWEYELELSTLKE